MAAPTTATKTLSPSPTPSRGSAEPLRLVTDEQRADAAYARRYVRLKHTLLSLEDLDALLLIAHSADTHGVYSRRENRFRDSPCAYYDAEQVLLRVQKIIELSELYFANIREREQEKKGE